MEGGGVESSIEANREKVSVSKILEGHNSTL